MRYWHFLKILYDCVWSFKCRCKVKQYHDWRQWQCIRGVMFRPSQIVIDFHEYNVVDFHTLEFESLATHDSTMVAKCHVRQKIDWIMWQSWWLAQINQYSTYEVLNLSRWYYSWEQVLLEPFVKLKSHKHDIRNGAFSRIACNRWTHENQL